MRAPHPTLARRLPALTLLLALPLLCAALQAQSTPPQTPDQTPTPAPSTTPPTTTPAAAPATPPPITNATPPATPDQTQAPTTTPTPDQTATPAPAATPTAPAAVTPPPTAASVVLTIHILNAKSGKPMRLYSLRAEYQGSPTHSLITADKDGVAHLEVPPTATAISLIAAVRKDHPDQPAYTVCGPFGQFLSIPDLAAHGFVPENACSDKLRLNAQPGEVFYLVEPLPWYNPATE